MEDLMKLRESIDEIDSEIVRLYKERMDISKHVAEYKITTSKKVFDKTREDEKLEKLSSLADDEFLKHGIVELFEQIMSTSRKKQYQLMTEHGIVEKENFTEVDSLDFSNARIVFQGVEDGLFRVFRGMDELTELDREEQFNEGDEITFIRLTMLAGRMW